MKEILSLSHDILTSAFWKGFLEALEDTSRWQDEIYVWLSGGSSLDTFYAIIRERYSEISPDIRSKICFCCLDERIVAGDHRDSNMRQLREKFLRALVREWMIEEDQIIWVSSSDVATQEESVPWEIHKKQILRSSGWQKWDRAHEYSSRVPRIDIGLFGVGPDGHIASLFPHHPLLDSLEDGYLEITDSPKPPPHRITVSPRMIRDMKYVFIAFMKWKEEAYIHFLDADIWASQCPAKLVKRVKNLVVMGDIIFD